MKRRLSHEVFRSVAEHLVEFRRDRPGDSFRGWLRTITRNKVRDHFRRRAGEPRAAGGTDAQLRLCDVPDPLTDDDPSEAGVVAGQVRRVLDATFEDRRSRTRGSGSSKRWIFSNLYPRPRPRWSRPLRFASD